MQTFQVNLFAMAQLCAAFGPGMRERGFGRIVNVTSGIKGQPNLAPYSASKAAVDKYTQDLAQEFAGSNVLVNHIDPGWIKTDLGGPDAWEEVSTVLPGMLVPVLLDDNGPSGRLYAAQDFKGL
jgi:NAD(P)-dependent dehydrogenase (short-subunit alcohol dehydrogenase family)